MRKLVKKPIARDTASTNTVEPKRRQDEPRDPVARFHLRNGARLERINWLSDRSAKGLRESAGLLVNYVYDRKAVARNHEAYVNDGEIARSPAIDQLLKERPHAQG